MANKVFGIRLDPRQAWAWQRLGNAQVRSMIAPAGACVQCRARPCQPHSRNGWFCYPCQDQLDQQDLLPRAETEILEDQNRQLRAELATLRAERNALVEPEEPQQPDQLSLFLSES